MKSLLLVLLLASAVVAQVDRQQPKEPIIIAVAVCQRATPPDAKPGTTTLDCGKDFALEFPDWFATFKGEEFRVDILDNGKHRLSKEQPAGSEVRYTPPCPPKPKARSYDDARAPLNKAPCNPDLKPE